MEERLEVMKLTNCPTDTDVMFHHRMFEISMVTKKVVMEKEFPEHVKRSFEVFQDQLKEVDTYFSGVLDSVDDLTMYAMRIKHLKEHMDMLEIAVNSGPLHMNRKLAGVAIAYIWSEIRGLQATMRHMQNLQAKVASGP